MMPKPLYAVAALALVAVAATGANALIGHESRGPPPIGGAFEQKAMLHGVPPCKPTGLESADGSVEGGCIQFTVDVAAGVVSDLSMLRNGTSTLLVEKLTVAELAGSEEQVRHDYRLVGGGLRFTAMDAPGAGFSLGSLNGTSFTIEFPADATVAVHAEVEDWSPAGATMTYGDAKANLVLPPGSTVAAEGNTLTITAGSGVSSFHLLGPKPKLQLDGHGLPQMGGMPGMEGGFVIHGDGEMRGPPMGMPGERPEGAPEGRFVVRGGPGGPGGHGGPGGFGGDHGFPRGPPPGADGEVPEDAA